MPDLMALIQSWQSWQFAAFVQTEYGLNALFGAVLGPAFLWSALRRWRRVNWRVRCFLLGSAGTWASTAFHKGWFVLFREYGFPGWMVDHAIVAVAMAFMTAAGVLHLVHLFWPRRGN